MSTAIAVYSKHHGNTRKLVDAIKNAYPDIKVIDVTENKIAELSKYDAIGVASGIYAGRFNSELMEYLREKLPGDKKVFAIYTYAKKMIKILTNPQLFHDVKDHVCKTPPDLFYHFVLHIMIYLCMFKDLGSIWNTLIICVISHFSRV